jgi:predicted DNA-binding transcriptional regulator AlpA
MEQQLLTAKEVAKQLGVTTTTLAIWRYRGMRDLPWVKLGNRMIRYRVQDVEAYVRERTVCQ